jgi:hypothetical protein
MKRSCKGTKKKCFTRAVTGINEINIGHGSPDHGFLKQQMIDRRYLRGSLGKFYKFLQHVSNIFYSI